MHESADHPSPHLWQCDHHLIHQPQPEVRRKTLTSLMFKCGSHTPNHIYIFVCKSHQGQPTRDHLRRHASNAPETLTGGYDDDVDDKPVNMWSVGAMMYMLYWPRHTPSLEYRDRRCFGPASRGFASLTAGRWSLHMLDLPFQPVRQCEHAGHSHTWPCARPVIL